MDCWVWLAFSLKIVSNLDLSSEIKQFHPSAFVASTRYPTKSPSEVHFTGRSLTNSISHIERRPDRHSVIEWATSCRFSITTEHACPSPVNIVCSSSTIVCRQGSSIHQDSLVPLSESSAARDDNPNLESRYSRSMDDKVQRDLHTNLHNGRSSWTMALLVASRFSWQRRCKANGVVSLLQSEHLLTEGALKRQISRCQISGLLNFI